MRQPHTSNAKERVIRSSICSILLALDIENGCQQTSCTRPPRCKTPFKVSHAVFSCNESDNRNSPIFSNARNNKLGLSHLAP